MCGVPLPERCHSGVAVDRSTGAGQVAQRMRILHLAKYYWPRSGGMERVVQDLAEGAAALGHEVSVVAVESRVGGRVGGQKSTVTRVFSFGALGSEEIAPGYLAAARRRADPGAQAGRGRLPRVRARGPGAAQPRDPPNQGDHQQPAQDRRPDRLRHPHRRGRAAAGGAACLSRSPRRLVVRACPKGHAPAGAGCC